MLMNTAMVNVIRSCKYRLISFPYHKPSILFIFCISCPFYRAFAFEWQFLVSFITIMFAFMPAAAPKQVIIQLKCANESHMPDGMLLLFSLRGIAVKAEKAKDNLADSELKLAAVQALFSKAQSLAQVPQLSVALAASSFNFFLSLCTLSNQMTLCFELLMQIPL